MTPDEVGRLRVGDEEREVAAAALGEAYSLGRLDDAEYHERLDAAWTSRTRNDLDALFHDLPVPGPTPVPVAPTRGSLPTPVVVVLVVLGVLLVGREPWLLVVALLVGFVLLKQHRRRARRAAGDPYWR